MASDSSSAARASSSRVGLTNTPTISTARRSSALICTAVPGSQRRGLCSQWLSPIAQAPRRTASRASSIRVMPQNLTFMGETGWRRMAAADAGRAPRIDPRRALEARCSDRRGARGALPARPARHPLRALDQKAMQFASEDDQIRAALFRLVDVSPACRSVDDLATHLIAYLEQIPERAAVARGRDQAGRHGAGPHRARHGHGRGRAPHGASVHRRGVAACRAVRDRLPVAPRDRHLRRPARRGDRDAGGGRSLRRALP